MHPTALSGSHFPPFIYSSGSFSVSTSFARDVNVFLSAIAAKTIRVESAGQDQRVASFRNQLVVEQQLAAHSFAPTDYGLILSKAALPVYARPPINAFGEKTYCVTILCVKHKRRRRGQAQRWKMRQTRWFDYCRLEEERIQTISHNLSSAVRSLARCCSHFSGEPGPSS
ncbi:hypothetical protein L596_004049 [Steinernema carpocapsae]|uniref:Uncharacterized protein n=1 Tax=Steinernema carpocapsae TaxID=34508 RepID=A0A4U8UUI6_STECR|nr:hypothetical protein L596_004049 [Steinernema carpocapsae]